MKRKSATTKKVIISGKRILSLLLLCSLVVTGIPIAHAEQSADSIFPTQISEMRELSGDAQPEAKVRNLTVAPRAAAIAIPDAATLAKIGTNSGYPLNGNYIQTADIDISNYTSNWMPIGTESAPFKGTFDGNGHGIFNLNINRTGAGNVGLFGSASDGAVLTNIHIESGTIIGSRVTGAILGYGFEGTIAISKCSNKANVTGQTSNGGGYGKGCGGIVGQLTTNSAKSQTVSECFNTGIITTDGDIAGGVLGLSWYGAAKVDYCYNKGNVTATGSNASGGVVGWTQGSVSNSYNTGAVSTPGTKGAVAGYVSGTVTNCYYNNVTSLVTGKGTGLSTAQMKGTLFGLPSAYFTVESGEYPQLKNNLELLDIYPSVSPRALSLADVGSSGVLVAKLGMGEKLSTVEYSIPKQYQDKISLVQNGETATVKALATGIANVSVSFKKILDGTITTQYIAVVIGGIAIPDAATFAKIGVDSAYPLNGKYIQTADIDISKHTTNWEPIGTQSAPFTGRFDGNGYRITNLNINKNSGDVGLFGTAKGGTVLKNIHIESGTISGSRVVGGLLGYAGSGSIAISQCSNKANITVGSATGSGYGAGAAGLVGHAYNDVTGSISECFNLGNITGSSTNFLAGIVGLNYGTGFAISNCYNKGDIVSAGSCFGGITGWNGSNVTNCYNVGAIRCTGSYVGTVLGYKNAGTNSGLYYNKETSVATAQYSEKGLTTAQMQGTLFGLPSAYFGAMPGAYPELINNPESSMAVTPSGLFISDVGSSADLRAIAVQNNYTVSYAVPEEYKEKISVEQNDNDAVVTGISRGTARVEVSFTNTITGSTSTQIIPVTVWGKEIPDGATLAKIGTDVEYPLNGNYFQTANIDLSGYANWTPIGRASPYYTGTYDGMGYKISGLKITGSANDTGLFGCSAGAGFYNIKLERPVISGGTYVGGIVGRILTSGVKATMQACVISEGTISGTSYIGGAIGYNDSELEIKNTEVNDTALSASQQSLGGILGYVNGNVLMEACDTNGNTTIKGTENVGGLVGRCAKNVTIDASYNTATVSGTFSIGGLVSQTEAEITILTNSYNLGQISSTNAQTGGLIGYQHGTATTIQGCYNAGKITATGLYRGGISGYSVEATQGTQNYYTEQTSVTYALGSLGKDTTTGGFLSNKVTDQVMKKTLPSAAYEIQGTNYPILKQNPQRGLDFTPPVISAVKQSTEEWASAKIVTANITDNESGVDKAKTFVSKETDVETGIVMTKAADNDVWTSAPVTECGTYYVISCDQTGNRSVSDPIVVEKIDNIAPTGSITVEDKEWTDFKEEITFDYYTKAAQKILIAAQDEQAGSGMDTISYLLSDQALTSEEVEKHTAWKEYPAAGIDVAPNMKTIIYVKLTDKVGNTAYLSGTGMIFDNIPPEMGNAMLAQAPEWATENDAQAEVVVSGITDAFLDGNGIDVASGISKIYLMETENETDRSKAVASFELLNGKYSALIDRPEKTSAYYLRAVDNAGNWDTQPIRVMIKVDISAPKISEVTQEKQDAGIRMQVRVSDAQEESGIAEVYAVKGNVDGPKTTMNVTENEEYYAAVLPQEEATYYIVAADKVGHKTISEAVAVGGVDRTPPIIENVLLRTDNTVYATITDLLSGVGEVFLAKERDAKSGYVMTKTAEVNRYATKGLSENGTYYIVAIDMRGNRAVKEFVVRGLDKTAPRVTAAQYPIGQADKKAIHVMAEDIAGIDEHISGVDPQRIYALMVDDPTAQTGIQLKPETQDGDMYRMEDIVTMGTYYVFAYDKAGNRSANIPIVVDGVTAEHIPQFLSVSQNDETQWSNEKKIIRAEIRFDSSSADREVVMTRDAEGSAPVVMTENADGTYSAQITQGGLWKVMAMDKTNGTSASYAMTVRVDKDAPILNVLQGADNRIKVTAEDRQSGIKNVVMSDNIDMLDAQEMEMDAFGTYCSVSLLHQGIYYIQSVDMAGNATQPAAVEIRLYDTAPPAIENVLFGDMGNGSLQVSFTAEDRPKGDEPAVGIVSITWKKGKNGTYANAVKMNETQYYFEVPMAEGENEICFIRAEDYAGNVTEVQAIDQKGEISITAPAKMLFAVYPNMFWQRFYAPEYTVINNSDTMRITAEVSELRTTEKMDGGENEFTLVAPGTEFLENDNRITLYLEPGKSPGAFALLGKTALVPETFEAIPLGTLNGGQQGGYTFTGDIPEFELERLRQKPMRAGFTMMLKFKKDYIVPEQDKQ